MPNSNEGFTAERQSKGNATIEAEGRSGGATDGTAGQGAGGAKGVACESIRCGATHCPRRRQSGTGLREDDEAEKGNDEESEKIKNDVFLSMRVHTGGGRERGGGMKRGCNWRGDRRE